MPGSTMGTGSVPISHCCAFNAGRSQGTRKAALEREIAFMTAQESGSLCRASARKTRTQMRCCSAAQQDRFSYHLRGGHDQETPRPSTGWPTAQGAAAAQGAVR